MTTLASSSDAAVPSMYPAHRHSELRVFSHRPAMLYWIDKVIALFDKNLRRDYDDTSDDHREHDPDERLPMERNHEKGEGR